MAPHNNDTTWNDADDLEFGNRFAGRRGAASAWDRGDDLFPGEPIGTPPRRKSRLRKPVILLVLAGSGWGLFETEATWRPWLAAGVDHVKAELERRSVATSQEIAAQRNLHEPSTALEPLVATKDISTISGTESKPPTTADTAQASSLDPTQEAEVSQSHAQATLAPAQVEAEAEPLPPPEIDPGDPLQKRAAAVGLHPQLSTVLLSSLTDTDYRNAASAIRRALTEASDTAKFIWPRAPAKNDAIFQVHFVTGDRRDCRRYIVTVVKNGWTTTAPPLEKCGRDIGKRSTASGANSGIPTL